MNYIETHDHATHEAKGKYALTNEKQPFNGDVAHLEKSFPNASFIMGFPGETGFLAIDTQGNITHSVRSPLRKPAKIIPHPQYKEVTFGRKHTAEDIEPTFLREYGKDSAAKIAEEIIGAAKYSVHLPYFSSVRGSEVESHLMDPDTGAIIEAPPERQEELCRGMVETALDPARTIEEGIFFKAKLVVDSQEDPDGLRLNTSVPLSGSVADSGFGVNNGHYEDYVAGISTTLKPHMGRHDEHAGQVGDNIAKKMGYQDLEEMIQEEPTTRYWFNAAGHHSVSLPHIENETDGKYEIPTEIAIAAADVAASDMGAVTELLTFSSPLILGDVIKIQTTEGEKWPLDYREIYRHINGFTFPGELIRDAETLKERNMKGVIEAETHTIDRTAFRTVDDKPSHYGPVRMRIAKPADGKPIGRIEGTGSGITPSLIDEAARDVVADVLNLAAFEAVANGQHPAEYWGEKYPSLAGSANRKNITRGYNLNGPHDETAGMVIEETLQFLDEMGEKYPPYRNNILFAQTRIENLKQEATARTLTEYAKDPTGPISQVMQHMVEDGYSPLEISLAVVDYELTIAEKIIKNVYTNSEPKPIWTLAV